MSGPDQIRRIFDAAEEFPADNGGAGSFAPPPDDEPIEARCAEYPLNDYGNGCRFVAYFGEDCLFAPRVGWHRWTGKVWQLDEDKIDVRRDAQKISQKILDEIPFVNPEDWEREAMDKGDAAAEALEALPAKEDRSAADTAKAKELSEAIELGKQARQELGKRRRGFRSHAKSSGNTGPINNMLTEASVAVSMPIDKMNADPLVINTLSGTIRLSEGVDEHSAAWGEKAPRWGYTIEPHNREHHISKIMPIEVDPDAGRKVFDRFLERIQPDPEMRGFLKRWFGYSMTGLTGEQKLVFAHGAGRNGKSTLVDAIAGIMADYAITVPIESLTGSEQRKGSDATPDLVRIPGARMVRASEPEQGQKMKEALIKALTGGEPILIRRMQQEFVEVTPEFKLTIQGNHKPDIRGGDDGIWRRVLLVPFDVQIPAEEVDPVLPERLKAEAPGIFNWMLEGLVEYLNDGLQIPESIAEATAAYRQESDPIRVFLLEECKITGSDNDFIPAKDVIDSFRYWLSERGDEPWGKRQVSNQMRARSGGLLKNPETGAVFKHHKRNGNTGYLGLAFTAATASRLIEMRERERGGYGFQ